MHRKEIVKFLKGSAGQLEHLAKITEEMLLSPESVFDNINAFKRYFNGKTDEFLLQELIDRQKGE